MKDAASVAAPPAAAKGLAQALADGDSHNGSHAKPPPASHGASGTDATAGAPPPPPPPPTTQRAMEVDAGEPAGPPWCVGL